VVKYFCDDCGEELSEKDSIAIQLDMTNHVYCYKCRKKRSQKETKTWKSTKAENRLIHGILFEQKAIK
jgi:uncharacterized CHY-type Zn-finger protein